MDEQAKATGISLYEKQKLWLASQAEKLSRKRDSRRPVSKSEVVQMLINKAMKEGKDVSPTK